MAKPKLALIPAAQGDKFYSVLPSSGVGDFDFTRSGGATRINSQGLIETVADGVSRLNYPLIDGKVVGCPSHLLEPQSTNTLTYSEDFSQWNNLTTVTLTSGQLAPDGTLGATKISGTLGLSSILLSNTSTTATRSIYARTVSGTGTARLMSYYGNTNNLFILTEEWQRFELTGSSSIGGTNFYLDFRDNSQTLNEFIIWGAQSEELSYPTSYIKSNSGSTTTRSAETANNSGDSSTFNDSEGVLMFEGSALANDGTNRVLSLSNGGYSNSIRIQYYSVSNQLEFRVVSSSSAVVLQRVTISDTTLFNKILVKYKLNDFALWVNGFEILTDTSGATPIGLNEIRFDDGDGNVPFYGNTKQIQYYDSADIDLETLTSWVSFSDMAEGQLYSVE